MGAKKQKIEIAGMFEGDWTEEEKKELLAEVDAMLTEQRKRGQAAEEEGAEEDAYRASIPPDPELCQEATAAVISLKQPQRLVVFSAFKMIQFVARRVLKTNLHVSIGDLENQAMIAACRAVLTWEPERALFRTYVRRGVLGAMIRFCANAKNRAPGEVDASVRKAGSEDCRNTPISYNQASDAELEDCPIKGMVNLPRTAEQLILERDQAAELRAFIDRQIATLNENDAKLLRLNLDEGYEIREAAAELGMSDQEAYIRMRAIRNKMRGSATFAERSMMGRLFGRGRRRSFC